MNFLLENGSNLLYTFVEKKPYFFKTKLTNISDLCDKLFNKYLYGRLYTKYTSNYNLSKLLIPYILDNISKQQLSIYIEKNINAIATYNDGYKYFELFDYYGLEINYNYIDESDFPVIADCLKYGDIKTLYFLINKNVNVCNDFGFYPERNLIDCALYNHNYRILEVFLDYYCYCYTDLIYTDLNFLHITEYDIDEFLKIIFKYNYFSYKSNIKNSEKKKKNL